MTTLREAAEEFLGQSRLAVAGVPRQQAARQPDLPPPARNRPPGLRHQPQRRRGRGRSQLPDIESIPVQLDGIVTASTPAVAESLVAGCANAGVRRVWLHRVIGPGSMSDDAVAMCREHGIAAIPGGCPNMSGATSDPGHKGLCVPLDLTGKIPRRVETPQPTVPA